MQLFHLLLKTLNLQQIRKFALEKIRNIRDSSNKQREREFDSEAGTSLHPKKPRALLGTTSKVHKYELKEDTNFKTAVRQLRSKQYQRRFRNYRYTDVNPAKLKKMANEQFKNESKPLTNTSITRKPKVLPKYDVHRDVLTHEVVIKQTGYSARDKSIPYAIRQCWRDVSFLGLFTGLLPIIEWLPKYSLKRDLVGDIIAGITVAIMHIPHGMAYGLLAGVSPGNGLYMAVFPVLVYMMLGTSRHISIGTFAVISMMTLKVVQTYATDTETVAAVATVPDSTIAATVATSTIAATVATSTVAAIVENSTVFATVANSTVATTVANSTVVNATVAVGAEAAKAMGTESVITPLEVVTALALTVGFVHLIMGFLKLGTLAALLSEPLVNGFTTGAACHVVTSQLKDVFGVHIARHKGAFKIIYTLIDLLKQIPNTNMAVLIFCAGIIVFMTVCNECIKPCLRKRCRFPLPAELIAVIGGTLISMFAHVNEHHGVQLVGEIPKGLPAPVVPRFDLIPSFILDSIAIAFVSYSIVMSMGLTFAKKHAYEVRANQELLACGMGNFVGSFFSCIPLGCSLSRSVIQEQTGGKTQLASLVSTILVIITLYWAGPFFSDLPRCVLAGVIIVALKPMFMQAKELKKFFKQGKLECFTWIITFFSVVLIDIDIGLLIGVVISLFALYIKGLRPYCSLLGTIPEAAAVYVDKNVHNNALEVPETKIFRYTGSLNFATNRFFRRALYKKLGLNAQRMRRASYMPMRQNVNITVNGAAPNGRAVKESDFFRFLIFDFSMLGHMDVAGCAALTDIQKEMAMRGIRILISCPADRVYDTIIHSMALGEGPFEIFPTLHDAVVFANACRMEADSESVAAD